MVGSVEVVKADGRPAVLVIEQLDNWIALGTTLVMAAEQQTVRSPFELFETDITPFVSTYTGDVVATTPFVDILGALWAFLAGVLDHLLGGFFVLLPLLMPAVVLVAGLALVPENLMLDTMSSAAFLLLALELGACTIVDVTRVARRGETPPEIRNILQSSAGCQSVVSFKCLRRCVSLHIWVLQ